MTYYCKKSGKKYICKAILVFLSGLEPLAFFLFFCQPELLMNEVHLTAVLEASDRRLTEISVKEKNTNVNVTYVGFVVHLW